MEFNVNPTPLRCRVHTPARSIISALTCGTILSACGGNSEELSGVPSRATLAISAAATAMSQAAPEPTTAPLAQSTDWRVCATEYETCRLSGTQQVRYGHSGKYAYGMFNNSVSCSNAVFGDPLPGELKRCEVAVAAVAVSAPAPAPVVTAAPAPVVTAAPAPVVTAAPAPVVTAAPSPAVAPATSPSPAATATVSAASQATMAPAPATTVAGTPPAATAPAVPAPAVTSATSLSIAGMRADMVGSHESTIVGIDPAWSWGSAADPGYGLTGYPAAWTMPAYTMWGIVGSAASGNPATNVRVQIRNLRTDFKRGGAWNRAQLEKSNISGANYTNFSTNASVAADTVQLGTEGLSVKVIQSGGTYHFYPSNRVLFPRDLQALVVSMDVRLVKDNANGIDDIDSARIFGVAAGDIHQSMTSSWNGTTWTNGHAPIGRFRQIGREWRTLTAHIGLSTDDQFGEYIAWEATQPR